MWSITIKFTNSKHRSEKNVMSRYLYCRILCDVAISPKKEINKRYRNKNNASEILDL